MSNPIEDLNCKEIEEIEEKEYTDEELADMIGDVELFYKKWGEKILKLLIFKQLQELGTKSQSLEDLWFVRGTINGLKIVQEWFKDKSRQSLSRHDKPEEETVLGEIE